MTDDKLQTRRRRTPAACAKRSEIITKVAHRLLAEGVAQVPFRDLALMLGTSDRMLLYYFENKADLVQSCIEEVAEGLGRKLVAGTRSCSAPADLLRSVSALFQSAEVAPYLIVWADVSARGGRGEEPYRSIVAESFAGSLAWLEAQLDIRDRATRRITAASILTIVEGARMLASTSPETADHAVAYLADRLEIGPCEPEPKVGARRV